MFDRAVNTPLFLQKQPSRRVLRKRCPEKMQQMYRKTPAHKFAAYFQNTVLEEHLRSAVSVFLRSRNPIKLKLLQISEVATRGVEE